MSDVVRTPEEPNDAVEFLKERIDRFEKMATIQNDALLKWPGLVQAEGAGDSLAADNTEFEEMVESLEWLTAQLREYKDLLSKYTCKLESLTTGKKAKEDTVSQQSDPSSGVRSSSGELIL